MKSLRPARLAGAIVVAMILAGLAGTRTLDLRAATPSSGTLSPTSGPVVWTGFSTTAATAINGEDDCVEGSNCDTFVLKLAAADYRGQRVRYNVSWTVPVNDYDVYVHAGPIDGPVVSPANGGAPATAEQATFHINAVVTAGVNDTYTIRVVYWTVAGGDPYRGEASLEAIPPVTEAPVRTATIISSSKTGISFSRNRTTYAFGAGQDVEPSVRVDYQGNMYAGGIRGLTGGNDIWRFDLNPNSPTYDPFLTAATPTFDLNGNVTNPAWKGQPDAVSPNDPSDMGGDGGGDLDIAVGFKPLVPTSAPPIVATSSLVAANVSTQRSTDRGDTFTNNAAGNTIVPVDDRQWNEFLGDKTVYLGYREFTGLQVTSKYYINRSDDGGLTYGPAVLAAVGGNTTGNIDVDQRDGTVYFCHQGPSPDGNQVRVAVGHPVNLATTPVLWNTHVAATGKGATIAALFPVCKVASDGTVYVAYSDAGTGVFIAHSMDQGNTWSKPVRVSDVGAGGVALMPWIETGERSGSLAIVWYGATAADSDDGKGGNTNNANWRVYFAQTLNATAEKPVVYQAIASDHVIHGANISLAGFTTGDSPNRNLADFFQVAVDPQGLAVIAFADDSNDFAAHTYVTHQIGGISLHTGKTVKIKSNNAPPPVATRAPQVFDFRHDARVVSPPPIMPNLATPADILTIGYGCEIVGLSTWISATMRVSGLDTVPPHGTWRINFATNPTKPGVSDRADQWFLQAGTTDTGGRTYAWGTAVRNNDGSITYTVRGAADAGSFDLVNRSLTMKVDVAKLNALQTRGSIGTGTVLMGLRGSTTVDRFTVSTPAGTVAVGLSDSTRGGGTLTLTRTCS